MVLSRVCKGAARGLALWLHLTLALLSPHIRALSLYPDLHLQRKMLEHVGSATQYLRFNAGAGGNPLRRRYRLYPADAKATRWA